MKKKWSRRMAAALLTLTLTAVDPAIAEEEPLEVVSAEETQEETPAPKPTGAPEITAAPVQPETEKPTEEPVEETEAPETPIPEVPAVDEAQEPVPGERTQEPMPSQNTAVEESVKPEQVSEVKVICSIAALDRMELVLSEKPSYEQALLMLPGAVEVRLEDETAETMALSWSCTGYDKEAENYRFVSRPAEEGYVLGESVQMPTVTLRIERPTEIQNGDFTYKILDDDRLSVIGYSGSGGSVSIPASAGDRKVTAVERSAFAGNGQIIEIRIGTGMAELDDGAFQNCGRLEKVTLPDSLEKVGTGAFDGCDRLESVTVCVSGEIEMTSQESYVGTITENLDGQDREREVSVRLGRPVTDVVVSGGGCWRVACSFEVKNGHEVTIAAGGRLEIGQDDEMIVLGRLNCSGEARIDGRVVACAGIVTGVDENVVREHSWSQGRCTICGEPQQITLTMEPVQDKFEKTYDGKSGVALAAEDFTLTGVVDGDDVYIAAINTDLRAAAAGSYTVKAEAVLGGEDASRYSVQSAEVHVTVKPKSVRLSPRSGQNKTYGDADPVLVASYSGVVAGEVLSGTLAREKGEGVGKYKILIGSLNDANPNYTILMDEAYFEIRPKSIADSDIRVSRIANQRYTGSAVTPTLEVRDGSTLLRQGRDYEVSFSENVGVGTASVEIRGMGNYGGSRQTSFKIIKVKPGAAGGEQTSHKPGGKDKGSGRASLSGLNDFGASAGSKDAETDGVQEEARCVDRLTINDEDLGALLFDEMDQAVQFIPSERLQEEDEQECRILSICAAEKSDEVGEYASVQMKLPMTTVSRLRALGYTHIELIVGEAEVRMPLATLYAEYATVNGTLCADHYEIRLWPVRSGEEAEEITPMTQGRTLVADPVHFEILAMPAAEEGQMLEGEDVLNLLEGVQLLFAPADALDYAHKDYVVVGMPLDSTVVSEAAAQLVMNDGRVECPLTPIMGGVYVMMEAME